MSKYLFPLNLQLFADEDPEDDDWDDDDTPDADGADDDFEDDTDSDPQGEPTSEPDADPAPADPAPAPKLKLTYNGTEEEYTEDDFRALAQKGRNYEKAQERAAQEARDAYVAEQGMEWRGQPIKTEAQYKQALKEKEWEDSIRERNKNSLPDDVVNELVEAKRFREEHQRKEEAAAAEAKQQAQVNDFLDYFQRLHDRPFSATDVIPASVKAAVDRGEPLKSAYMEYQNAEMMKQLRTQKQNEANAAKAAVKSVTNHGSKQQDAADAFLAEWDKD